MSGGQDNAAKGTGTAARDPVSGLLQERGEEIFSRFDRSVTSRLWQTMRPHRTACLVVLLTVALYTGVQVLIPVAVRHAVDSALGQSGFSFDLVLAAFALLIVLNAGLTFLQEWLAARLAQTVIFDLRRAMFDHLQRISLSVLCLLYTSPSPRDKRQSRMPSSA